MMDQCQKLLPGILALLTMLKNFAKQLKEAVEEGYSLQSLATCRARSLGSPTQCGVSFILFRTHNLSMVGPGGHQEAGLDDGSEADEDFLQPLETLLVLAKKLPLCLVGVTECTCYINVKWQRVNCKQTGCKSW